MNDVVVAMMAAGSFFAERVRAEGASALDRLVEPLAFDPVPCNGAPGLFAPDRATFATVSARWTEARFG